MLQEALTTLPPTLDATYDRILSAIREDDSDYAIRILRWLTFSARPLLIDEVAEIVAIDIKRDPAFDRNEALEDPLEILDICSNLITIIVDGRQHPPRHYISFAHYSVKQYLLSDRIWRGKLAKYGMQAADCHDAIATSCVGYLLQFQQSELALDNFLQTFRLARYSAEFWISHAQKLGNRTNNTREVAIRLCSKENPAYLNWIRLYDPENRWEQPNFRKGLEEIPDPLYYVALSGLRDIVKSLIDKGTDVNVQGGKYGSPLQAASVGGHLRVVELLLDNGANVNAKGGKWGNALQAASVRGDDRIVELLLDNGAKVNAKGGGYDNALLAASVGGYKRIVKLLLDNGADVNAKGGEYGNALQAAASLRGHEQIVKLLLNNGADVNAKGGKWGNALQAASVRGDERIVKLLLDNGAKVHARGRHYQINETSGLHRNEQDDQASTTESLNTLWSHQERSTNPSSLSYEHAADMEQIIESRSSMTFFNYKKPGIGSDQRDDDIQSVQSIPDDIDSLAESNSSAGNYRQAAVNYFVKMFTDDAELLSLYQGAVQRMDEVKFVRSHQRLLKKFFLDLSSKRHTPSQALAIGFLRARSKRIHISSEICNLVMTSNKTAREKINVMLKQEKDSLFLIDRLMNERDSGAQQTLMDTAEGALHGNPSTKLLVSSHTDTVTEENEDSNDDDDRSSDESEAEIQEDNALSKLEATAEFLTSGQPFSLYKRSLRGFLHPTSKADSLQESLALDVVQTNSKQSLDHTESECSDIVEPWPLQEQTGDNVQMIPNAENRTDDVSRIALQTSSGSRNYVAPQLEMDEKGYKYLPNLPQLIEVVLQGLSISVPEPRIPEGKARARWKCVIYPAYHLIVTY
jgi:ankyrin repeat protein